MSTRDDDRRRDPGVFSEDELRQSPALRWVINRTAPTDDVPRDVCALCHGVKQRVLCPAGCAAVAIACACLGRRRVLERWTRHAACDACWTPPREAP
jgi:hypothetical protein